MNQEDSGFGTGSILLSFLVGGLIGGGVVLLTAQKTGKETRKMIKEPAEEAKGKAKDYIDQVKNMVTSYFKKGKDFVEKESNIITKVVEAGKEATAPYAVPGFLWSTYSFTAAYLEESRTRGACGNGNSDAGPTGN